MRQIHSIYCLQGSQVEIRNLSANCIWERFERGTVFVCMEMGRVKGNDHEQGETCLCPITTCEESRYVQINKCACLYIFSLEACYNFNMGVVF